MSELPFYCQIFRSWSLLEPCQKNLLRVKALKEAKKHIGPLEKCVECKGKMLITKTVIEDLPAPTPGAIIRYEPGDSNDPRKHRMPEQASPPEKASKPYRHDWDPNPEVTTAPRYLKDVVKKEPEMQRLSPEKIAEGREAVKKLSESYKIAAGFHFKPKKQEEPVPTVKITEREAVKMGGILPEAPDTDEAPRYWPPAATLEALEVRYCKAHPKVPQRKDRLGRWMGMCDECLSARGKKWGEENFRKGVTAAPMTIPLNLPQYADLKAWLGKQAEFGERKLWQQIMFILKMAYFQGGEE